MPNAVLAFTEKTTKSLNQAKVRAILIPSGGGKTTLAASFDALIDHDDLIDKQCVDRFKDDSNFQGLNSYFSSINVPPKSILLTWGWDTTPVCLRPYICASIVRRKENLREYNRNVRDINLDVKTHNLLLIEHENFESQVAFVLALLNKAPL